MICDHEVVCKHKSGDESTECSLKSICKFSSGSASELSPVSPLKKRKYRKRDKRHLPLSSKKETRKYGSGRRPGDFSHLTTSDKDIRRAKNILNIRKVRGSLSENQIAALDMHKQTKLKDLAEHQRQQILSILNDTSQE